MTEAHRRTESVGADTHKAYGLGEPVMMEAIQQERRAHFDSRLDREVGDGGWSTARDKGTDKRIIFREARPEVSSRSDVVGSGDSQLD